jgi:hypothetical protein
VADSQPAGARIFIEAGTHQRQQVFPKTGQEFVGAPGAVMDGLDETAFAFSGSVDNVIIDGIEIKNYSSGSSKGAVHTDGTGWLITNSDIHDNAYAGVSIRGGSAISNSHIYRNAQFGILVNGGTGAVIDGNEIDNNNHDQTSGDYYFAGAKFLATKNLVVRNNSVHHNHGYGLWTYKDNTGTIYQGNVIEGNYWAGISHDQSYAVTIDANEFRGNGVKAFEGPADARKFYFGAVQITGPDATVTNNVIDGNQNAVVVIGYDLHLKSGLYGPLTPFRTTVMGNTITASGNTGLVTNHPTPDTILDTAKFDDNDYIYANTSGDYWVWNQGGAATFTTWQGAYGQDPNGSLSPL